MNDELQWLSIIKDYHRSNPEFAILIRLPDINAENEPEVRDVLLERKDPRQIFYGLWPGWVVNLKDKTIIKPKDEELKQFYASWRILLTALTVILSPDFIPVSAPGHHLCPHPRTVGVSFDPLYRSLFLTHRSRFWKSFIINSVGHALCRLIKN